MKKDKILSCYKNQKKQYFYCSIAVIIKFTYIAESDRNGRKGRVIAPFFYNNFIKRGLRGADVVF